VRKAERARFLSEGEESEALRINERIINGARPHFVRKRTFSYRKENNKWGLAPFIPWGKSNVFWNHIA